MKILLAPDTFKDSLSAPEVIRAMKKGISSFTEDAQCFEIAASDGGEGFLQAVQTYIPELTLVNTQTVDPLGRDLKAEYLWDEEGKIAYIELAKAFGLELLAASERNPTLTSTYGTGLQIRHAIDKGAQAIYLGLGGSSTNDGGTGIAYALGFDFHDNNGNRLVPVGGNLHLLNNIVPSAFSYTDTSFYAVNDVLNPLHGPKGAAFTYAKQKGASQEMISELDHGLRTLDRTVQNSLGKDVAHFPGAGAAGGTAYGLKSFLDATFLSGASFILKLANFRKLVEEEKIDLIITGEGKIDHQTSSGKFVSGLIQEAKQYGVTVIAICGKLELNELEIRELGLKGVLEIYDPSKPKSFSYENAASLIAEKTAQLLRQIT